MLIFNHVQHVTDSKNERENHEKKFQTQLFFNYYYHQRIWEREDTGEYVMRARNWTWDLPILLNLCSRILKVPKNDFAKKSNWDCCFFEISHQRLSEIAPTRQRYSAKFPFTSRIIFCAITLRDRCRNTTPHLLSASILASLNQISHPICRL